MIKEPPKTWSGRSFLLYSFLAVAFCCSTANGYDGSLFGTLLANEDFKLFYDLDNIGSKAGVVTAMYQIGSVVAIPFIGPAIDTYGRRGGMFVAGLIISLGVIIEGTTINNGSIGQFMGGRFLMGFGVAIIGAAGPVYVVEMCHPAHRGVITGLYNVFWPVGALVASGAARAGLNYGGNASWLLPLWLQIMFPGIVTIGSLFLPESPRWLYTRGRVEKATANLARFHGQGNPDSEWVKLQIAEYEEHLEMDGTDKSWWDYRALFRDHASRYRLLMACIVSLFGQEAGNGIVSYFLSGFLDTAGVTGAVKQTNVQMGMNGVQIFFAALGASFVEKLGRRPMLIWVNIACGLCWVGITAATSVANLPDKATKEQMAAVPSSVSQAVLGLVYLFQIMYSFGWTPMQALYPVEVLSFEMRAKGMAFSNLFTSVGLLANQFGVSVALERIAWRTYIVFCIWCFIQAAIIWMWVPETKGRTLEELDDILYVGCSLKNHNIMLTLFAAMPRIHERCPHSRRSLLLMPIKMSSTLKLLGL